MLNFVIFNNKRGDIETKLNFGQTIVYFNNSRGLPVIGVKDYGRKI